MSYFVESFSHVQVDNVSLFSIVSQHSQDFRSQENRDGLR